MELIKLIQEQGGTALFYEDEEECRRVKKFILLV
jgi:hypothetical protein